MTVSDISSVIWNFVTSIMGISIPVGEYSISFMTIFLFAVIGRLMMIFVNRVLERTSEEDG